MWVFLVLTTDKFSRGMSGIPVKSQNFGFKDHRVKLTVKFLPSEWRQQGEQVQHTGRAQRTIYRCKRASWGLLTAYVS